MADVIIRREGRGPCEDRQTVAIQIQAKEHQGIPEDGRNRKDPPLQASKGHGLLTLDFWPPEL